MASIADNIHEDNLIAYLDAVFWNCSVSHVITVVHSCTLCIKRLSSYSLV
jgi:hypothetical protein